MSTTSKILKTIGPAAVCNGAMSAISSEGIKGFCDLTLFFTAPALLAVGVDKLVNQKITNNETIQCGLTIAESLMMSAGVLAVYPNPDKSSKEHSMVEMIKFAMSLTNIIMQPCIFKYIWDSSDEINSELDSQQDLIEVV